MAIALGGTLTAISLLLAGTLPIFLDEAVSINEASLATVRDIVGAIRTWDIGKPPLYFVALHYWLAMTGPGELLARLPSVLGAAASAALMYVMGKHLFGVRTALLALALLAVNPEFLIITSWARMYSAFFLLSLASTLLLARVHAVDRPGLWVGAYGTCLCALLYLHYFAVLVIAVHVAYAAICLPQARWRVLAGLAVACAGFAPWLTTMIRQVSNGVDVVWTAAPSVWTLLGTLKHLAGSAAAACILLPAAAWGVLALCRDAGLSGVGRDGGGLARVLQDTRQGQALALALIWLTLPPLLMFAVGRFVTPIWGFQYLLFVLPALLWLAARGIDEIWRRRGRTIALGVLVALVPLEAHATVMKAAGRPDWRPVARQVAALRGTGDLVVVENAAWRLVYGYYDRGARVFGAWPGYIEVLRDRSRLLPGDGTAGRVWVVLEEKDGTRVSAALRPVMTSGNLSVYQFTRDAVRVREDGLVIGFP